MKIIRFTFLLTLLVCFVAAASAHPGDDKVVVKVEKIVGNEKSAEKLAEQLKKIEGVQEVNACTVSGNVTIGYDSAKLANSDAVYSALDARGVQYAKASSCCAKGAEGTKAACSKDTPTGKTCAQSEGKAKGCKSSDKKCSKPCDKGEAK